MARFILDVANLTEDEICKVFEVIERDSFIQSKCADIKCIDKTNTNQFYNEFDKGETNELTKEQIDNFKKVCNI